MKITKKQLRRIIREAGSPDRVHSIDPLTGEDTEKRFDDVDQIITQGQEFFDKVIQLSQDSEDDPAAQAALEQIVDALAPEVEKKSFGYVKFKVTL